jgi:hypothetical protein
MCGRPTGPLWPKPNGEVRLGNQLLVIDATNVQFPPTPYSITASILSEMVELFREEVRLMACNEQSCDVSDRPANYRSLQLRVQITLEYPNISNLEWNTDESYTVVVRECENSKKICTHQVEQVNGDGADRGTVRAEISAATIFGARHALETLTQLMTKGEQGSGYLYLLSDATVVSKIEKKYNKVTS